MRQHDGRGWRTRLRPRVLLALPGFAWTSLFFLAPLALLLVYSLGQIDVITFNVSWGWTLESYRRIGDPLYLEPILRSILLSGAATILCLLIGFPVALWISRLSGRRQTLALVAVMIPFWSSFVVRTYALVNLLGDGGPLADGLSALHLSSDAPGVLYTPLAIAIGIVYSYLPLMILPPLRCARADRSVAPAGCRRPRRSRPPDVPPRRAAARGAGRHRGLHPRRHPGHGSNIVFLGFLSFFEYNPRFLVFL